MTSIKCYNCGHLNNADTTVCEICGADLINRKSEEDPYYIA